MQYQMSDNKLHPALYEGVLTLEPENVCRGLRIACYSDCSLVIDKRQGVSLSQALQNGLATEAQLMLERARLMAEKAVENAPDNPVALRLGVLLFCRGRVVQAMSCKKCYAMDIFVAFSIW